MLCGYYLIFGGILPSSSQVPGVCVSHLMIFSYSDPILRPSVVMPNSWYWVPPTPLWLHVGESCVAGDKSWVTQNIYYWPLGHLHFLLFQHLTGESVIFVFAFPLSQLLSPFLLSSTIMWWEFGVFISSANVHQCRTLLFLSFLPMMHGKRVEIYLGEIH